MCYSIESHFAAVMQFQVENQALCLFSSLITNTLVCGEMRLLRENKIQFTCICHQSIVFSTQRQEIEMKDASY